MAKVTEQDVIAFLNDKITSLNVELKKTQAALEAFTTGPAPVAERPAISDNQISAKSKRGRKSSVKKEVKTLEAPAEFDKNGKLDGKVAYILASNGPLFNTDIIEKLKELEPEKDPDKLTKAVMVKLSALHKAGKIKGEKEGRKFKYQI